MAARICIDCYYVILPWETVYNMAAPVYCCVESNVRNCTHTMIYFWKSPLSPVYRRM